METMNGRTGFAGKRKITTVAALLLALGVAVAAATFIPANQPYGYVAPPALSSANFKTGNVVAYTPWFDVRNFRGDVSALPVGPDGSVALLAPLWQASFVLAEQDHLLGRRIVTTDGAGTGIPFRFAVLTPAQQAQIGTDTMLNFVRGDRSNEGGTIPRVRDSVLGDIIHSAPVYVGKPNAGYTFGDYLAFASANTARPARVYVGANDGMLHALDAATGEEVFGYVPSMVIQNLPKLAASPYDHTYYVDGFLAVEDAQFGTDWHSVLVGGLGAGGKGFFALDVTNPSAVTELAAADKILWEFRSDSPAAGNLGYSYGRPSIVRLNNDSWVAVVANGYLSPTGVASLYVLDIETGAVIRELVVPDVAANGLSSPTLIDADGDSKVDTAYAGDLNGNLWKFDLSGVGSGSWSVAYGGQPLFQTEFSGGVRRPITTAPEVGRHPVDGVMVYVGTGRLFSPSDGNDKSQQAVYGIWDNDWASGTPIASASLVQQQLKSAVHADGESVRVATANAVDWDVHRGWVTPTEIAGASTLDQGERVIQDLLLRDGRVAFMTVNPTIPTGENWFLQLDGMTGGAPSKTIVDVNLDFLLDVEDNVDGNADGEVQDKAVDRVVGQYQQFGLASRPVVGILDIGRDAALINHLSAISPNVVVDITDPGLIGGHFDLDTAHEIYAFGAGSTDGHVHEWDDKHDLTTIDYFSLPDGSGSPLHEINDIVNAVDPDTPFILTVGNNELSPGGILDINGTSISVGDYRALETRYILGTLGPGENFPILKINEPTGPEEAAGVKQLHSLKLSFDAFAILTGDLIPTNTGCVRGNDPGEKGEYRNGALFLQALDASDLSGGFTLDESTQDFVANSSAIDGPHGYATNGLLWESTVFWHWSGKCYGEAEWRAVYDSCIVNGGGECFASSDDNKDKAKKKKKKKKKGDDDSPPDPGDPDGTQPDPAGDPGHNVTNTTIGGNNDAGRLFWRELVPED